MAFEPDPGSVQSAQVRLRCRSAAPEVVRVTVAPRPTISKLRGRSCCSWRRLDHCLLLNNPGSRNRHRHRGRRPRRGRRIGNFRRWARVDHRSFAITLCVSFAICNLLLALWSEQRLYRRVGPRIQNLAPLRLYRTWLRRDVCSGQRCRINENPTRTHRRRSDRAIPESVPHQHAAARPSSGKHATQPYCNHHPHGRISAALELARRAPPANLKPSSLDFDPVPTSPYRKPKTGDVTPRIG
jgi:hypothetical protein